MRNSLCNGIMHFFNNFKVVRQNSYEGVYLDKWVLKQWKCRDYQIII